MSYLISLAVGFAFGAGYALLGVRSPAPPMIALAGLLGILAGEHFVPWAKQHWLQPPAVSAPARVSGSDEPQDGQS